MRTTVLTNEGRAVQFDANRTAQLAAELKQFASAKREEAFLVFAGRNTEENLGYAPQQTVSLGVLLNEGGGAELIYSTNVTETSIAKLLDDGGVPLGFLVRDYDSMELASTDYELLAEFANKRVHPYSDDDEITVSFADAFVNFVLEHVGNADLIWMAFPKADGVQ